MRIQVTNSRLNTLLVLWVLAGCNQSYRSLPPPTGAVAPPPPLPAVSAAGTTASPNENPAAAPGCVPTGHEPETIALHRQAEELTNWKSSLPLKGQPRVMKILGFNDFHGQLSPPPAIEGRPIGGAAVLAAYFRAAARGFENVTLAIHAGDMIGASPPPSALNQDEPSVEFMGSILGAGCSRRDRAADSCHVIASLGNHEFDEGLTEFRRIVNGGNHERGPFLGHAYPGAPFTYIGANVHDTQTGRTIVEPYVVKTLSGLRIGLIGAVLREAPVFLMPSGIKNLSFDDEVSTINAAADQLSKQGVHTIVVVIHQGGYQCFAPGVAHDERAVSGPIVAIVKHLHPEVDVVVSGHTHTVLSALLPNSAGAPTLVTQAFHAGTGFAEIQLTIDSATDDVIEKQARIVSPWADVPPANAVDPEIVALVSKAEFSVQAKTTRIIGTAESTIHAAPDPAGNSELGDLIADAQREAVGADLAFTTPSWVRGNIESGKVTWGELFRIQPFGNRLMKLTLSGQQVVDLLNQQWSIEDHPRVLHISGISYRWDPHRAPNDRIVEVLRDGRPLLREKQYSVVLNEYLAQGGDAFTLLQNVPRRPTNLLDIDALERYVKKHNPLRAKDEKRIVRVE